MIDLIQTDRNSLELGRKLENSLIQIEQVLSEFISTEIISLEEISQVEVTIEICTKAKIQELNREYRKKDKPTDVLSFPVHQDLREKQTQILFDTLCLGDIFICYDIALDQAKKNEISTFEECVHLIIHGALHLLGYDHEISEDECKLMESLEERLLDKLYLSMN